MNTVGETPEPTVRGEIKRARAGNYDVVSCVCEFVDNAFDTGATRIRVDIRPKMGFGLPHKIVISDNSVHGIHDMKGIFSWTFERKRETTDIGEYGAGFKTAAVNMGEKLTVLTIDESRQYARQAIADWQDMSSENRWEPEVFDVSPEYFQKNHPYSRGSSFIVENLRNEIFSSSEHHQSLNTTLLHKIYEDLTYIYRYVLQRNMECDVTVRGQWSDEHGSPIFEKSVREHPLFQKEHEPFEQTDALVLTTRIRVYQDKMSFYRVLFEKSSDKWQDVECVEKRKNGNHHLRSHDVSLHLFDSMRLVDTLVFQTSCHTNPVTSSVCMSLYPTSTLDIIRQGRVTGRDIVLRPHRSDASLSFMKHEVWYTSYELNPLLGVQYNKQNHGVRCENDVYYTMEYIQHCHEREYSKKERVQAPSLGVQTVDHGVETPVPVSSQNGTRHRKHFTPNTKLCVLSRQECRDSVFDMVLKDNVLLSEYDHKDGDASHNTDTNCQVLSVMTHALKTRRCEDFQKICESDENKETFLVNLLNCISRSQYVVKAWTSGRLKIREPCQQIDIVQKGLFEYVENTEHGKDMT